MKNARTVLAALFFLATAVPALGTEDYSIETGQECGVCHLSEYGGGGLTAAGQAYSDDPDVWVPPAEKASPTPLLHRAIHAVVLYIHVLFGVLWIGTILYVHLVLKPQYALGGLPRSELRLAWLSMTLIAITGIPLTVWRFKLNSGLFSSPFGQLLILKVLIFALMVSSAAFVTLFIGPRLHNLAAEGSGREHAPGDVTYTLDELRGYDGEHSEKVLIAADGSVYDVTESSMWKGGVHAKRHRAGTDLTDFLDDAPHDASVLEQVEKLGVLSSEPAAVPAIVKIFKANAYFNLIGCFLILLVLVLWRW